MSTPQTLAIFELGPVWKPVKFSAHRVDCSCGQLSEYVCVAGDSHTPLCFADASQWALEHGMETDMFSTKERNKDE